MVFLKSELFWLVLACAGVVYIGTKTANGIINDTVTKRTEAYFKVDRAIPHPVDMLAEAKEALR